ncbi:ROK family protein [Paenibacillus roseipurpureus]|uniref:ROK family transcriptional regulator n=1 Tax=Paenibacillus roseopurpureus TaxID=2918901 RepID=A0AA96RK30_9BACL|nr:ROK family transcriptional regulator [Paenibacillus sp. MBLB1832]WNR46008.1 ROK family transcriptional regulator [Paenibacillus sp. MBLB1832]
MSVINTADIRSQNKKNIIQTVRYGRPITKKEIADRLNLSFATVSNLCNQLVEEGILSIVSSENSSGGRIPNFVSLEPNSRGILCLDLNHHDKATIALLNLQNQTIAASQVDIPPLLELGTLIESCYEASMGLLEKIKFPIEHVLGLGVAIPGIFYKKNNTVINSTISMFENQFVKKELEERFQLPAYLENESNILAVATSTQLQLSSGQRQDVAYLYVGDGLGVGITHRGAILTGNRGFGGEVSHMPIGLHPYNCYCGQVGCVETELSLAGFWRTYYGTDAVPPSTSLTFFWKEFVSALKAGDERAHQVAEEKGRLLGKLISVIDNLIDPDVVYVGGIIEPIFQTLYLFMQEEARSRVVTREFFFPEIRKGIDYEQTLLQGCSEMVITLWNP